MEDYITVSAKTLDDAITEALVQLGVTSDRLDYIVVEKGSEGFLGIGRKQAVIKARRKREEKPVEETVEESKVETPVKEEVKPEKKTEKKPAKEHSHTKKNVREEKPEVKSEPKKEVELAKVEPQTIETCEKFIYDVMNAMGMDDVKVTSVVDEEGALSINMEGSNMGILIGKRGQTLDSLQYLTNRVANKMQDGYVRVKLDTEDYRRRRKETLENLAKNIASKVKRTRKTVSLEPMNPYERRIIHATVATVEGATSSSIGEEPNRRVVISSTNPVKRSNNGYKGKKKPYNNKGGYRQNGRRPQGEGAGKEGEGQKKPYVFRPNTNTKEDVENRKRAPRNNGGYRERSENRFEDRPAPSNEHVRDEVPRSAAPREAEDKPLYAKIDLE